MTLTEKIITYFESIEDNIDIKSTSNSKLLMGYYVSIGLTTDTSMANWFYYVSMGTYPAYGSVTRAIRKARELHPRWKKLRRQVDEQITHTKQEVGYDTRRMGKSS